MPFLVSDILPDVRRILGKCSTDTLYRRISDAVDVLAKSGDFDLLTGFVDICVDCRTFSLPRDIPTVMTVNIGGRPAMGRDQYHQFHLNGPGSDFPTGLREWEYLGTHPTYRDLTAPSKLVALLANQDDEGVELWAYGYDVDGNVIRTQEGGGWVTGYRIPTIFGMAIPDAGAPVFARITALRKGDSTGPIRVQSFDASAVTGTLLAVLQWDEHIPAYQRIRIGPTVDWVRVGYRKPVFRIRSEQDIIALPSLPAIYMMIEAMKWYAESDLARGAGFEATARRMLGEAEWATTPPLSSPIQVHPHMVMITPGEQID